MKPDCAPELLCSSLDTWPSAETVCASFPTLELGKDSHQHGFISGSLAQGKSWTKIPRPSWERKLGARQAAGLQRGGEPQFQIAAGGRAGAGRVRFTLPSALCPLLSCLAHKSFFLRCWVFKQG